MPFLATDHTEDPLKNPRPAAGLSLVVLLTSRLYAIAWRVWRQLFLLTLLCCVLSPVRGQTPSKQSRVVVSVNAACFVHKEKVLLADVATIVADAETTARLRTISLGYAPDVGSFREISREKILLAITAAGFASDRLKLEAPPAITIRRESQIVDQSLVRDAVEHAALTDLKAKGALARLIRLDLPERIEAPTGQLEARASLGATRNLFEQFIVSIEIWVDGRIARRMNAVAQVEAFAPVIVAEGKIAANTKLHEPDYSIEIKKLDRSPALYLTDYSQLRGVSTVRALSYGEPITSDAIRRDIVVRPGDAVRIMGESTALKVMVTGEARAAGHVGDRIQVKNLQSGQLLQAVIVDEGLVSVRF